MTADAPVIVLERGDVGFRVHVSDPPEGFGFDETFPTYRQARGHAGGMRMVKGWRLDDRTEGIA